MKVFTFSKKYKYFIIPLLLLLLTWSSIFSYEFGRNNSDLIAAAAVLFLWYRVFTIPYKIIVRNDHVFEFCSILKRITISSKNIVSIKDFMSALFIKHTDGKIVVSSLMNNISDFKLMLQASRPDLNIDDVANQMFNPKN